MRAAILALALAQALAWWSTGHLVTSTIAYNELARDHPATLKAAEAILTPLSKFFMEPEHEFISAAEWPDDIKGANWKSFNPLHFVNIPVIEQGFDGEISTSVTNASYGVVSSDLTLRTTVQL
jgi:hypothetical protein